MTTMTNPERACPGLGRATVALLGVLGALAAGGACRDDGVTLARADAHDGPDAGAASDLSADGMAVSDAGPANWNDRTPCVVPASAPVYRTNAMVAFDGDRRQIVLYGGKTAANESLTDIWDMDVSTGAWTQRTTCGAGPPPAEKGGIVYDRQRRRVLLFSGYAGEVWEWNPTDASWTSRRALPAGPAPSSQPDTALYDEKRAKVIVLTDNWTMPEPQGQPIAIDAAVWEWDGTTGAWQPRITTGVPWAGSYPPALAQDPTDGAVWLFGTALSKADNLWRLDPVTATLTDVTPAVRPAAWPLGRGNAGFASDRARRRLVLFGGYREDYQRDVWELDPATITWTNRTPANVPVSGSLVPDGVAWPAGQASTGMFEDTAAGQVVTLAGLPAPTGGPAVWAWDGVAGRWSTHLASDASRPRWPTALAELHTTWDRDRGELLLYSPDARELWRWRVTAGQWDRLTPDTVLPWTSSGPDGVPWPPSRQGSTIAYDAAARRAVIFGGVGINTQAGLLGDLWIWDPATSRMTAPSRPTTGWPSARSHHALVYDPVRRRVLMFGGALPEATDELWALDTASASWEALPKAGTGPAPRSRHALVLDEDRQVIVLQGGLPVTAEALTSSDSAYFDTWELPAGSTAWREPAPGVASLPWQAPFQPAMMAFVRGLGVVALGPQRNALASEVDLWRWNPIGAAWVPANVDHPGPKTALEATTRPVLCGGGDTLTMLLGEWAARAPQDRTFVETWEWKVPSP